MTRLPAWGTQCIQQLKENMPISSTPAVQVSYVDALPSSFTFTSNGSTFRLPQEAPAPRDSLDRAKFPSVDRSLGEELTSSLAPSTGSVRGSARSLEYISAWERLNKTETVYLSLSGEGSDIKFSITRVFRDKKQTTRWDIYRYDAHGDLIKAESIRPRIINGVNTGSLEKIRPRESFDPNELLREIFRFDSFKRLVVGGENP